MSRIPIKALKQMSKDYGLDHVIVYGTEGETQHIATYGRTIDECSEAADFGNKMKDVLGWPESLHQQPSRVRKLQAHIKELELKLSQQDTRSTVSDAEPSKNATAKGVK
jgi:hypothetical protein